MGANLSKALQKHYSRKGNRIVFSNGMTLNQLALEMWEKLGYKEIDSSVLTRVLKGERSLASRQVDIFASILKLANRQSRLLKEAIKTDVLLKHDLEYVEQSKMDLYIYFLESKYSNIKLSEQGSSPKIARQLSEDALGLIDYLDVVGLNSSKMIKIKELHASILIEYVDSLFNTERESGFTTVIFPQIEKLNELGKEVNNRFFQDSAESLKVSLYSLSGDHKSNTAAVKLLMNKNSLNEFQKITALKSAVVSAIKTKRKEDVGCYLNILRKGLNNVSRSFQIMSLYTIANCEGYLGNQKNAEEALNEAWSVYDGIEDKSKEFGNVRYLGIVKTELFLDSMKVKVRSRGTLELMTKSAIVNSLASGYMRAHNNFKSYLKQFS